MGMNLRPWQSKSLPERLSQIPAMITHEEQQYLVWLTEEKFEGWGAIVELGTWLGASSSCLAEGLRRRGSKSKIHSFDNFVWVGGYMESYAPKNMAVGSDFLPIFIEELGEYRTWVEPHKQDLKDYRWAGGPIEILFVDAAKSWDLLNSILNGFGDSLIPRRSRVVLQDYLDTYTHWLPLVMESRPDIWKEVESVENGTTVTFKPLKAVHGGFGISRNYTENSFPLELAEQLLRSRMSRETNFHRHLLLKILYRKYLIEKPPHETTQVKYELISDPKFSINGQELAEIEDLSDMC